MEPTRTPVGAAEPPIGLATFRAVLATLTGLGPATVRTSRSEVGDATEIDDEVRAWLREAGEAAS